MATQYLSRLFNAVIRVGDGRGFIVDCGGQRYVITAAHCLTRPMEIRRVVDDAEGAVLPPPVPAMNFTERTYPNLLAPLGSEPSVWAECLFVDPVADIAVLGEPDNQELADRARAYDNLVEEVEPLPIGQLPTAPTGELQEIDARLLSLDGEWFSCRVSYWPGVGPLWFSGASEPICGGMSGSPIVSEDGAAIGVVSTSDEGGREGGPNPCLAHHLPGWLWRA